MWGLPGKPTACPGEGRSPSLQSRQRPGPERRRPGRRPTKVLAQPITGNSSSRASRPFPSSRCRAGMLRAAPGTVLSDPNSCGWAPTETRRLESGFLPRVPEKFGAPWPGRLMTLHTFLGSSPDSVKPGRGEGGLGLVTHCCSKTSASPLVFSMQTGAAASRLRLCSPNRKPFSPQTRNYASLAQRTCT